MRAGVRTISTHEAAGRMRENRDDKVSLLIHLHTAALTRGCDAGAWNPSLVGRGMDPIVPCTSSPPGNAVTNPHVRDGANEMTRPPSGLGTYQQDRGHDCNAWGALAAIRHT